MPSPRADDIDRHVAAEVRRRRVEIGLTQQKLADLIGVTYQQARKYEMGKNRIACSRLYVIAKALGCEIGELFPPLREDYGKTGITNLLENVAGLSKAGQNAVLALARSYAALDDGA